MKTRSSRYKENASYDRYLNRVKPDKYTSILVLTGGIAASIFGIITGRPEIFWICTITTIVSLTALLTGNRSLNSAAISALPLYIGLIPLTLFIATSGQQVLWENIMSIIAHSINLCLVIMVLILSGKRVQPLIIMVSSIFYALYIGTFIISIPVNDPYHAGYTFVHALLIIASGAILGVVIKKTRNVKYF